MDYMATLITRENNNIYVVGSDNEVKRFYNRTGYLLQDHIKGIVLTERKSKVDGIDIPVVLDTDIPFDVNTIVVCASFERKKYESIQQLFEGYGFEEGRQFFQGEVFSMVYEVYVRNMICLDRVEIFMTSYCTLQCEKCIAYIPYFENRCHTPIEQLKNDADILFEKVDYIYKYKVLGGEGFLYPDLVEYLDYVCNRYGNKIESLHLGSNGTIHPKQEVLDMCRRNNIIVDISDYTNTIGYKSKLKEIKDLCLANGISVDVKRTGEQWLDMGFPVNRPGEKNEEQLRKHFSKCAMFCRDFNDGKLYYCCSNFSAVMAGIFKDNRNDYFDFREEFTKKELLEYELGYSSLGHTTFCEVCRGCSDEVNPFHVEVAKQMI